ncbi:hypothetical protein [Herbiconiux sp. VKM Ac-2851]|uniref:hypothetical protein n=1 Tax=Herbiconiux sp. VKM Ac-2851 TaxID=2739025 RepID=UPI001566A485|nr:hypothetical protein [Herbiconiux sp. VKM Ac-2851]NQX35692.1 hypothetical protein [Herbiconiux sp. VKM Ac-2851]
MFTTNVVLVADVDPDLDGVLTVKAAKRSSLIGMTLSTSERIDAHERLSHDWPGVLDLVPTYSDLSSRIAIVANGAYRYNIKEPSPIVTLIEGLSADLASKSQIN